MFKPQITYRLQFTFALLVALTLLLSACGPAASVAQPPAEEAGAVSPTTAVEPSSTPTVEIVPPTATATTAPPTPTATSEPPTPTVEPTPANLRVAESDGMEQILIPAGEFTLGTFEKDAQLDLNNGVSYPEVPPHTVNLEAFWIDKFEVTNRQWALCVAAGVCQDNIVSSYTRGSYYGNPEFDNYPVIYVDWWMASDYCAWAGRRLPTEAEWEKAARGTDERKYPWGDDTNFSDKANFCDVDCPRPFANAKFNDGYPDTAPVGSFPAGASPYGVMDMSGNVWEWTSSLMVPYPYDASDGRENQETYDKRIWRGGTWTNGTWYLRATVRYRSVQKFRYYNLGFRCAASQ